MYISTKLDIYATPPPFSCSCTISCVFSKALNTFCHIHIGVSIICKVVRSGNRCGQKWVWPMRKPDPVVNPLADQGRPHRVPSYLALYPSSLLTRGKKRELGIKRESLHWISRHSLFCICIRTFWRRRDFRLDGITPAPQTATCTANHHCSIIGL